MSQLFIATYMTLCPVTLFLCPKAIEVVTQHLAGGEDLTAHCSTAVLTPLQLVWDCWQFVFSLSVFCPLPGVKTVSLVQMKASSWDS